MCFLVNENRVKVGMQVLFLLSACTISCSNEQSFALLPYKEEVPKKKLIKDMLNLVLNKRKSDKLPQDLFKQWGNLEKAHGYMGGNENKQGEKNIFLNGIYEENSPTSIILTLFSLFNGLEQEGVYNFREVKDKVNTLLEGKNIKFDLLLPLADELKLPKLIFLSLLKYLWRFSKPGEQQKKCGEEKIAFYDEKPISLEEKPKEFVLWKTGLGDLIYQQYWYTLLEAKTKRASKNLTDDPELKKENKDIDDGEIHEKQYNDILAQSESFEFLSKYLCLYGAYKKEFFSRVKFYESTRKLFEKMRPKLNIADFLNLANAVIVPQKLYYPFFNYLSELIVLNKKVLGWKSEYDNAWKYLSQSAWGDFLSERFLSGKIKMSYWKLCRAFFSHTEPFEQLLWLPGNKCLIIGGKSLFLWDFNTMKVFSGEPFLDPIKRVAVDESGVVFLLSTRGRLHRMELLNNKLTLQMGYLLPDENELVTCFAPAKKIGKIAWQSDLGRIGIFDLANNGNELFFNDSKLNRHICFMPEGDMLIVAEDSTILLIDVIQNTERTLFEGDAAIKKLILSGQGNVLVASTVDDVVKVWLRDTKEFYSKYDFKLKGIKNPYNGVVALALSPNEKLLGIADEEGVVRVIDLENKELIILQTDLENGIVDMQFDHTNMLLAVQGSTKHMQIWDLKKRELLNKWQVSPRNVIKHFSLSPFEERFLVASGGLKNMVQLLGGTGKLSPLAYLILRSMLIADGCLKTSYTSTWLKEQTEECRKEINEKIAPAELWPRKIKKDKKKLIAFIKPLELKTAGALCP